MCCLRGNPALLSPSWSSSVGNDSAITVRTVWLQRMLAAGLPQSEWGHPVKHMLQVYHLAPNTGAEKCDAACCKNACMLLRTISSSPFLAVAVASSKMESPDCNRNIENS